ncbi:MAG: hypothetical protein LBB22_05185 [Treponema sp.]|jgi:hypothetical protein|nr:hypothetical protein [Treponema sp.]
MAKTKSFYGIISVVFAVLTLNLISCKEVDGFLDLLNDDRSTGDYSITIKDDIQHGVIIASRSRASKGQLVTVMAVPGLPSAWVGTGAPPDGLKPVLIPGSGGDPLYSWYLNKLNVTYGEKNSLVWYEKNTYNEWKFTMPAGDVVIDALFSQTPLDSNELLILEVNPGVVSPDISSTQSNYKAVIPHINIVTESKMPADSAADSMYSALQNTLLQRKEGIDLLAYSANSVTGDAAVETDVSNISNDTFVDDGFAPKTQTPTFTIVALPEDPYASVLITQDGSSENLTSDIPLSEGETDYKITVTPQEGSSLQPRVYSLTVSYEPDLTINSIKLTSTDAKAGGDWSQNLPVMDTQGVTTPYSPVKFNVTANDKDAAVSIKKGTVIQEDKGFTLSNGVLEEIKITVSKTAGIKQTAYSKEYVVNIIKSDDPNIPLVTDATGGGITIIKKGDKYYEVHTFTSSDNLIFKDSSMKSVTADILVVAGGGGGGYCFMNGDGAGGGGAGGLAYKTSYNLSLTKGSVAIKVGAGGERGNYSIGRGKNGGASSVGNISALTPPGGGGGGLSHSTNRSDNNASSGGSGGGAGAGYWGLTGDAGSGTSGFGNSGGIASRTGGPDGGGGGGGAGGCGQESKNRVHGDGGAGRTIDINGTSYVYSRGGDGGNGYYDGSAKDGESPTMYGWGGNGGGDKNNSGGNGASGIVIIRFELKPQEKPVAPAET